MIKSMTLYDDCTGESINAIRFDTAYDYKNIDYDKYQYFYCPCPYPSNIVWRVKSTPGYFVGICPECKNTVGIVTPHRRKRNEKDLT